MTIVKAIADIKSTWNQRTQLLCYVQNVWPVINTRPEFS